MEQITFILFFLGYEEAPTGFELDDGVYYNKYMPGNKIKMSAPLSDELVEYSDGTQTTTAQMAKDVTTLFGLDFGTSFRSTT